MAHHKRKNKKSYRGRKTSWKVAKANTKHKRHNKQVLKNIKQGTDADNEIFVRSREKKLDH